MGSEDTHSLPAPNPLSLLPFSAHTARRVLFLVGSITRSRTRRRAVWRRGEADASKSFPFTATSTFTIRIKESIGLLQDKYLDCEIDSSKNKERSALEGCIAMRT